MPGYDGTGPEGQGAMTGGGSGYCFMPAESVTGRPRFGRGLGSGGCKNRYYTAGFTGRRNVGVTTGRGKEELIKEAKILKQELSDIQSRISMLESSQEDK